MRIVILDQMGPRCLGIAIALNLYKVIVNINVCTEFELFEIEVPLNFLGPVGFSTRREGR